MYDWSPDSKYLAYLRFDERPVSEYTYLVYGVDRSGKDQWSWYPGIKRYKYPSAGGINARVSLRLFQLQTRSSRAYELPVDSDAYIPRIRFTCRSNQLAVMSLNRSQDEFSLYFLNYKSNVSSLALVDKDPCYVNPITMLFHFPPTFYLSFRERRVSAFILYHSNGILYTNS
jgi:dipeptidyl-peptidase-4